MKFTYLGTAAAEGFPAVFCNCEHCNEARKLGGKNIRTRSQAIIGDDLLIDLPADTYMHFLQNNILGHMIKNVLITHPHSDHFYPSELVMRQDPFAHNMQHNELNVYCGNMAYEELKNIKCINVNPVKPFETFNASGYEITALPARHAFGEDALFYIIKADKTVLYAHDTGYFYDEVFDYIKEKGLYFDMISLDCTNVDITISDSGTHMGIDNIERVTKRLAELSAINENTIKYINHFSHNANPIHHILEERVKDLGFKVSFDGLKVEI